MSYKFEIVRCTDCGAVWFDPPEDRTLCDIVYITTPCRGIRKRFAGVDSDSFTYLVPGWDGPP